MFKKIKEKIQNRKNKRQGTNGENGEMNNPSRFNQAVFTWTAPLKHKAQKGKVWMIMASIVVAALLFYGAYTANWFFLVAIMVAVIVYALDHAEPTKEIEIKISDYGIKIAEHGIPFSNIKSFWIIHYGPFFSKLYLRTYQHLMPEIGIELMDQDPAEMREFLTRHIVEWEGKQEGFMDMFTRMLRL